ncbi:MAG: helix-turn-helix transcriptional regulator [Pseudomonadota bacterium]
MKPLQSEVMAPRKEPNPIDVHVGRRLKLRRTMVGMTQEKLGEQLGVTFQQIQKYEKGTNRIGASRLQEIAEILEAPISFFFEDGEPSVAARPVPAADAFAGFSADDAPTFEGPRSHSSEAHALTKAFSQIRDGRVRRRIIDLVETLADAAR